MKIEKTYDLPFPVAAVYDNWVSSATIVPPATRLYVEPFVGGHHQLFVDTAEGMSVNEGRFEIVEPNRRLRFSWEWNHDGQVSHVDVRFAARPGGTEIHLVHEGLRDGARLKRHAAGWDSYIEGLTEILQRRVAQGV